MACNWQFQQIPEEDSVKLLSVLEEQLPYSVMAFNWLTVQMKWNKEIFGVDLQLFCPNGDWQTGTFLGYYSGLLPGEKNLSGMFHIAERVDTNMISAALGRSPEIQWSKLAHIASVRNEHLPCLLSVIESFKFLKHDLLPNCVYYMSADEAKNIDIPSPMLEEGDTIQVSKLDSRYEREICEKWVKTFDKMGSPSLQTVSERTSSWMKLVSATLKHNLSTGVFLIKGDKKALVASVLHTYYGGMGLLQTNSEHRGRGLASLALAQLARKIGQSGLDPFLCIMHTSKEAEGLTVRLGFRPFIEATRVKFH